MTGNPIKRRTKLHPLGDLDAAYCGAVAGFFGGQVLRRTPPRASVLHATEVEQRQTIGMPLTFQHIGHAATD